MSDEVININWHKKPDESVGFIKLTEKDNVAVALRTIRSGETLDSITAQSEIPSGHKLALRDIAAEEQVIKYSQVIGYANSAIKCGDHIHTHNLEFRATDHNYEYCIDNEPPEILPLQSRAQFQGYQRADGQVGTRNFIAILASVNCSATAVQHIANAFTPEFLADYPNIDGVVGFSHSTGCGLADSGDGFDNLQRVLWGYARHPNVAGVLLVGLGCEVNQISALVEQYHMERGPLLRTMNIQSVGGHAKTVAAGVARVKEMLAEANNCQRTSCPASALKLALQCGGSDAWSGITANPALGYAADLLVKHGGTAVLAETPEIYGAEHLLTRRASDEPTAKKLIERILWWEEYVARNGGSMDNNPSPGNKLGGLTTILEKSLGAVAKGGTTRLNGVFRYAEKIDRDGFVFMDSPGYDPASITGEVAGGCNLVTFTTGRGSTYGCKPAPSIKIATNTEMYNRLIDDMDINAGRIVSEGASIEEVGQEIFDTLLTVASGTRSLSENLGLGDHEFVPWQIGATM
ncbi:galactonate dehydratase [Chromatiales bacterium (ex Bugula neritina AB1)]|nr:galactonate dehydratase [Chromatiales bacterium (ex Bugula neritina AB1)]